MKNNCEVLKYLFQETYKSVYDGKSNSLGGSNADLSKNNKVLPWQWA